MMRNLTRLTFGTLLLALLPLCGCEQGLGGGAYTPSSVTLIVSNAGGTAGSESPETVGPAVVAGYGTVRGKVVIDGSAPVLAMLVLKGSQQKAGDELCAVDGVPNESVIADANGGLANVFIYLKKVPKGVPIPPAPTDKIIFDQKGCSFTPHAFVARVGQTIVLTNSDSVVHNVHTSPNSNREFKSAIPAKKLDQPAQTLDLVYEKPEENPVKTMCDFHSWMDSYHHVVNHPWAVVTGADGTFEIPGVPAGKMTFIVWHEKAKAVNRGLEVVVVADQTVEVPVIQVPAAKLTGK